MPDVRAARGEPAGRNGTRAPSLADALTLPSPNHPAPSRRRSYADTGKLPDDLWPQVDAGLEHLQGLMKAPFGSGRGILGQSAPPSGDGVLLVSVRSGAAISMPGMMDTVRGSGWDGTS